MNEWERGAESEEGGVESSCHVSVRPEKSIEEEVKRLKICKKLLSSGLVFYEKK